MTYGYLVCAFLILAIGQANASEYKKAATIPPRYHGPNSGLGWQNLREIPVSYFGPSDPADPEGGAAWLCAQEAVQNFNREGGLEGKWVRLIPAWSENPWGAGVAKLTRDIYLHEPWAMLGSLNGHTTHLAEQVVTKTRLPLLDPGSTDTTVNQAQVPWVLSLLPGDSVIVQALAQAYVEKKKDTHFILISSLDHDSRQLTRLFLEQLSQEGLSPDLHIQCKNIEHVLSWLRAQAQTQLVLLTNSVDGVNLLRALSQEKKQYELTGGPAFNFHPFLSFGQTWPGRIYLPRLHEPSSQLDQFVAQFAQKHSVLPDELALTTYDALTLLTRALKFSHRNREDILQALRTASPFHGLTGTIHWLPNGRNSRDAHMAYFHRGKWESATP